MYEEGELVLEKIARTRLAVLLAINWRRE